MSVLLGGVGLLFSRQIMVALNTPDNILSDATTYLDIYFIGLPFLFMYNVLSSMFNALGRSQIPLALLIFSSLFNVGMDLYMVCVLEMGVAGAAWATLIAQGISAVAAFVIFLRQMRGYKAEGQVSVFDLRTFREMCRIALPSILQQSTVSIGMMLVQSVVNSFGSEVLAGYSAGSRIESIAVVPMSAMGNVMSSYTAQNLGAGRQGRVVTGYHTAFGILAAFAAVICVILVPFAQPIIGLFLGEDGTALAMETGVSYLRFIGWFLMLIGMKMVTDGLLRGAGDMTMFTIANMVNLMHPGGRLDDDGAPVRDRLGLVRGAGWLGGQLHHFLYRVPEREMEAGQAPESKGVNEKTDGFPRPSFLLFRDRNRFNARFCQDAVDFLHQFFSRLFAAVQIVDRIIGHCNVFRTANMKKGIGCKPDIIPAFSLDKIFFQLFRGDRRIKAPDKQCCLPQFLFFIPPERAEPPVVAAAEDSRVYLVIFRHSFPHFPADRCNVGRVSVRVFFRLDEAEGGEGQG